MGVPVLGSRLMGKTSYRLSVISYRETKVAGCALLVTGSDDSCSLLVAGCWERTVISEWLSVNGETVPGSGFKVQG